MSQFMKDLEQPVAELANRQSGSLGPFWAGRFKSVAILDDEALLAVSAYVDLNPFAAGKGDLPEQIEHTSLYERKQSLQDTRAPRRPKRICGSCRSKTGRSNGEQADLKRRGQHRGFTLKDYLNLVDWTARLFRQGKARLSEQVPPILARLELDQDTFVNLLERLRDKMGRFGYLIGTPARVMEIRQPWRSERQPA